MVRLRLTLKGETVNQQYLTVPEVAQRLTLSEEVVRRWLRSGKLRGTLLSRRAGYRIPTCEVERVLKGGPAKSPAA
jgi:excisionase family DNA binding protein